MRIDDDPGRRRFLKTLLAAPFAFAIGLGLGSARPLAAASASFAATPECADDDEPTPAETAGPFFKPRSPRRNSLLEPSLAGSRVVLTGRVFTRDCAPVAGALLDFWHADDEGEYDNEGFRLRGHQFADAQGRYRLETIVPGAYAGRTRHIHVRVQAPKGKVLTTQLYFPGEPRNQRDGLFRSDLLVTLKEIERVKQARFHFLLRSA